MVIITKCDKCNTEIDVEVEDALHNANIDGTKYAFCSDCEFIIHHWIRSRITGRESKLIREENERQQANVDISR